MILLPVLSDKQKQLIIELIIRKAENSLMTALEIVATAGVNANVQNIRVVLGNGRTLKRMNVKVKPPLTKKHISQIYICIHTKWTTD